MTKPEAEAALRAHLPLGSPITVVNGKITRRQYQVVRILCTARETVDCSPWIAWWLERAPLPHGILLGRYENAETILCSLSQTLFDRPDGFRVSTV